MLPLVSQLGPLLKTSASLLCLTAGKFLVAHLAPWCSPGFWVAVTRPCLSSGSGLPFGFLIPHVGLDCSLLPNPDVLPSSSQAVVDTVSANILAKLLEHEVHSLSQTYLLSRPVLK